MRSDMPRLIVEPFLPHGQPGEPALACWLGSFTMARLGVLVAGLAAVPPMLIAGPWAAPLLPVVLSMVAMAALGLVGVRFGRPRDALAMTGAGALVLAVGPWPDGISLAAAAVAALALGLEWLAAPHALRTAAAAGATLVLAALAVMAAAVLRHGGGIGATPALLLLALPLTTLLLTLASQSRALGAVGPVPERVDSVTASALAAERTAVLVVNRQAEVRQASPAVSRLLDTDPSDLVGRDFLDRILIADRPALLKTVSDIAAGGRPATVNLRIATGARAGRMAGPPDFASLQARIEPAGIADTIAIILSDQPAPVAGTSDGFGSAPELAAFAHDIRSPMNAVLGFSAMLANRVGTPADAATVAEYGAMIHASANAAFAMTQTLVDRLRLDRLESAAAERIDLGEGLRAMMASHASRMQVPRSSRTVTAPRDPLDIDADPVVLRMLLANLVEGLGQVAGTDGSLHARLSCSGQILTLGLTAAPGAGAAYTGPTAHLDLVERLARRLAARLDGTLAWSVTAEGATVRLDLPAAPVVAVLPAATESTASFIPLRKSA